jgi:uncharacterized membrane protein
MAKDKHGHAKRLQRERRNLNFCRVGVVYGRGVMSLPPMHPALVHLPIAFVVLSVVADLAARFTRRESLRHVGLWSIIAALLGGIVTIAAGYWDMNRASLAHETHEYVDLHLKVGWVLAAGLVVLTIWRWRIRQQARRVVTKPYAVAALLVLALTLFQGWFGGEMVYSHGAGVAAAGQGTEPAARAQDRLAAVRDFLEPGATAVGAPGRATGTQQGHGPAQDSRK